jgi:hypothetical protein
MVGGLIATRLELDSITGFVLRSLRIATAGCALLLFGYRFPERQ